MTATSLTTAARVYVVGRLGASPTADVVANIAQLIPAVSVAFESKCDRSFIYTASRSEFFEVLPGQHVFKLRAYPNIANVTVYNDSSNQSSTYTQFPAATALDGGLYAVDKEHGLLRIDPNLYELNPGPRALKVAYDGGFSTSGITSAADFAAEYPDIADAIDRQVIYAFQQGPTPGVVSISQPGGSVAMPESFAWLPRTWDTIKLYRREAFGGR